MWEDFMRGSLGIGALGAAVGAGLMFLCDPRMGRRRRALLQDKTFSVARKASGVIDKTSRDVKNRTYGTVVTLKSGHSMGRAFALFNSNWPPAIRLMVGTTGSVMTAAGIAKGGPAGTFLGTIGIGSMILAITNFSFRDLMKRAGTPDNTQIPTQRNIA